MIEIALEIAEANKERISKLTPSLGVKTNFFILMKNDEDLM